MGEKRSSVIPTKSDLWEELQRYRALMAQLITDNTTAINNNTVVLQQVLSTIGSLQRTMDLICQQLSTATQGVPLKIFMIVVIVLAMIVATLVGFRLSDVLPITAP